MNARRAIVFVVGNRDPLRVDAGDISYIRAHARAAMRAGFEPHLFGAAPRTGVVDAGFGVVHGIAAPVRSARIAMMPVHAPAVAAAVERFLLARPGPHLIHGFGAWGDVGVRVRGRLAARGVKARTITSVFTTEEHQWYAKLQGLRWAHGPVRALRYAANYLWISRVIGRYERRAYRESCLVTLNYEAVRRRFLATHGPGAAIRKLPYTSEAAFVRDNGQPRSDVPEAIRALRPRDAPVVVALSRHDPRKGLDVLLHALSWLRRDGLQVRACLVGGGRLLAEHRRLAARLGLEGGVAITGWVPDSYPYLEHADVFALPSLQEGSGSVSLIEALQAGVPVVASTVDGIPEDVEDGDSAVLVEPADAGALCRALARVGSDGDLRRRRARRARETFLQRFSVDVFAGR
jgi:glycosyltransferase involved in cell wall biosynthesis